MAECNSQNYSPVSDKIRHQLRKESEEGRLQHRNRVINSARKNLTEIEDELQTLNVMTPDELAKTVAQIKSGNNAPLLSLRALKQALHNPDTTRLFLRTTGSLQAVVGHLTGRKALHQLEAAYICCNLATGDEYPCEAVTNAAGPYLIEYLGGHNTTLQVACLWTIGNLVGGSVKSFNVLLSQGLIPRLINCLKGHDEVIEAAVYALCFVIKMSFHKDKKCALSCKEMQEIALATVLIKPDITEMYSLLYLLSCSCDCDNILLENLIPQQCVTALLKLAGNTEDMSVLRSATAMIRATANLCAIESGTGALMVLNHSSFPNVLKNFLNTRHSYLTRETEWLLNNLLFHPCVKVATQAKELQLESVYDPK